MAEKRKVLIVATVISTIDQFCKGDIMILQKNYNVQVAANFHEGNNTSERRIAEFQKENAINGIKEIDIQFKRNPLSINNLFAYRRLKKLLIEEKYDLIHCHTPIASMLTRLANIMTNKKRSRLIYTAHGFHFYEGAPFLNWLFYYPVERWLSNYTDTLVTINKEDYYFASRKFKSNQIEYVPGIGVDIEKIDSTVVDIYRKRSELGLKKDDMVIISVGELNKNKNHEIIIRALANLRKPNIIYIICGQGKLMEYLRKLSTDLNVESQVHLLGFRSDVIELFKISDIFTFTSFREGLSVALMEAMATKLPVICSKIRGNIDLIDEECGGYFVNPTDEKSISKYIELLVSDRVIRQKFGSYNRAKVSDFSQANVAKKMNDIYSSCLSVENENTTYN